MITQADKNRAVDATEVSLNGYPATIAGRLRAFARVRTLSGPPLEAEFSWDTAKRILARGGKFRT